jgi:hypothetical protein
LENVYSEPEEEDGKTVVEESKNEDAMEAFGEDEHWEDVKGCLDIAFS